MDRFENSLEHLVAEAKRIDLMLRREIVKMRRLRSDGEWDEFRGLYISEKDMDGLLSEAIFPSSLPLGSSGDTEVEKVERLLDEITAEIAQRKAESLRDGIALRLEHLRRAFDLSPFEIDCLLASMLPELDLRFQKLYAYFQDDVTRKAPSVDMILGLLASSVEDRSNPRRAFMPQGNLLMQQIVSLSDPPGGRIGPLLEKSVKVDQRIVDYLLGSDDIDGRLLPFTGLVQPRVGLSEVLLGDDVRARLENLVLAAIHGQGATVFLHGRYGAGKRMTVEAVCHETGKPLLIVNSGTMLDTDLSPEMAVARIFREASLQKACLLWDHFDSLLSEDNGQRAFRSRILQGSMSRPEAVFISSGVAWEPATSLFAKPFLTLELTDPPVNIRKEMWRINLAGQTTSNSDVDLDELAMKFRFTGGQIRDAVADARNLAIGRGRRKEGITTDDLYQAARNQSNQKLKTLARKIRPLFTWEDIVLPKDQLSQLREITDHVKYRDTVFAEWNFDRKVSLGKGLNVLFAGPSGTGKTMAAEIVAGELGLDLYKIDLSTVVSKYIGETEKNLDRIFREAQDSNAILFFDEADAIFGKRSEVKDSHDRYANIEIAYLLQKMEEYDGIVILATNLRKNLDEAFARRMQFAVEFPLPEEPDRRRIWQQVFPREAPLASNADLGFMARQFKITGGNIKNIALGAAFLAASDGGVITTEHLVKATKREYQKIGRLCTENDFARYFELVKG